MPHCAAFGCNNHSRHAGVDAKGQRRTFHHFPLKRPEVLKRWIANVRRADFQPTVHSKLCSDHFTEDCFKEDLYGKYMGRLPGEKGRRHLKEDAAPTEFSFLSVRVIRSQAASSHAQPRQASSSRLRKCDRKIDQAHLEEDQYESNRADAVRKLKPNDVPALFCHSPAPKKRKKLCISEPDLPVPLNPHSEHSYYVGSKAASTQPAARNDIPNEAVMERLQLPSLNLVDIGEQYNRWCRTKLSMGAETDAQFAKMLLDSFLSHHPTTMAFEHPSDMPSRSSVTNQSVPSQRFHSHHTTPVTPEHPSATPSLFSITGDSLLSKRCPHPTFTSEGAPQSISQQSTQQGLTRWVVSGGVVKLETAEQDENIRIKETPGMNSSDLLPDLTSDPFADCTSIKLEPSDPKLRACATCKMEFYNEQSLADHERTHADKSSHASETYESSGKELNVKSQPHKRTLSRDRRPK